MSTYHENFRRSASLQILREAFDQSRYATSLVANPRVTPEEIHALVAKLDEARRLAMDVAGALVSKGLAYWDDDAAKDVAREVRRTLDFAESLSEYSHTRGYNEGHDQGYRDHMAEADPK